MLGTQTASISVRKRDGLRPGFAHRLPKPQLSSFRRITTVALAAGTIALSLIAPASAGDPFRRTSPHNIDAQTEAAFSAIFQQGNYQEAARLLQSPSSNEPLSYAMKASLDYIDGDLEAMGENATLTRESAEQLVASDALRGHLYTAVGHFLEGAYTISTQSTIRATPAVLGKLQQVFDSLRRAEAISPDDPELNLIRGYMDLILAVNLPFSNPQQAIGRLEAHAAPDYLAQRGIAIGYRDLNQQDRALAAIDRAIAAAPNNPDLLYLKAQILARQQQFPQSLQFFQQALANQDQLPRSTVIQISYEQCRVQNQVNRRRRDCDAERDALRDAVSATPSSRQS